MERRGRYANAAPAYANGAANYTGHVCVCVCLCVLVCVCVCVCVFVFRADDASLSASLRAVEYASAGGRPVTKSQNLKKKAKEEGRR